jgi:hypothetical protein
MKGDLRAHQVIAALSDYRREAMRRERSARRRRVASGFALVVCALFAAAGLGILVQLARIGLDGGS